jgi:hypothetical protein
MKTMITIALALVFTLPAAVFAQATLKPPVNLKIGSWNTMLQPWFEHEPDVIRTVAESKFDVLALQSVWTVGAKDRIVSDPGVRRRYPYHYYTPALPVESAGVDLTDPVMNYFVQNYVGCLVNYGVNLQQMLQPTTAIPFDCRYLRFAIGIHTYNPANQIASSCLDNVLETLPPDRAQEAIGICGSYNGLKHTHGGRPGLLILSRYPMTNVQDVPFESVRERRINTHATIAGLRFGFGHFSTNAIADFDPYYGPLQYGNLQPDQTNDMINAGVEIVVGTTNSGPDYQPEGHNILLANNFRPLFTEPTYCPAATHSNFSQCVLNPGPRSVDNIYISARRSATCRTEKFATLPISDHIGIGATCLFGTP